PRRSWSWGDGADRPLGPSVLEQMRRALSARYGVEFDSVGLNLYRSGRDSVAWHGDRIAKEIAEPLVGIVSVGEPRRFLLRPAGGGRSISLLLGRGELLVTGGATQRRWQHSVPKVASARPRISITFRHGPGRQAVEAGATVPELVHALAGYEALADCDLIPDHTIVGPLPAPRPVVTTAHCPLEGGGPRLYGRMSRSAIIVAVSQAQVIPGVPVARVI